MSNEASVADQARTTRPQDRFRKSGVMSEENSTLYFLAGAGLIKIGVTTNLTSRLRAIRNSSPVSVEVLATMPGCGIFKEMQLHDRFAALRRHGEWFEDDGSIRAYISRHRETPHGRDHYRGSQHEPPP
jgi:hypothetical protein